jgi:hypothetical protein
MIIFAESTTEMMKSVFRAIVGPLKANKAEMFGPSMRLVYLAILSLPNCDDDEICFSCLLQANTRQQLTVPSTTEQFYTKTSQAERKTGTGMHPP